MTKFAIPCSMILAATMIAPLSAQKAEERYADEKLLTEDARVFSLDGPEIYKVTSTSADLIVEDLNGDGLVDLAAIANDKSQLIIHEQLKTPDDDGNRFQERTVSLDRAIRWAVPYDVNGDGRIDILMAASPPKLVIMYQDEDGKLQAPTETLLEADMLTLGDLTGNGYDDLIVYHEKKLSILEGSRRGLDLTPKETFHTTSVPASQVMVIDIDGDGLKDLVYHNSQRYEEFMVRLQSPDGEFPSEFRLKGATMRDVAPIPAQRKGDRGSFVAVQNNTRELIHLALASADTDSSSASPLNVSDLQTIALDPDRRFTDGFTVVADIDGDGRKDFLLASKAQPLIRIMRQSKSGDLMERSFPSLEGITSVVTLPQAAGQPTPLIFFSPTEKAIGFSVWDKDSNQLPFPKILPIAGKPLGISTGTVGDSRQLIVLAEEGSDSKPTLRGFPIDNKGVLGEGKVLLAEDSSFTFEKKNAIGMEIMDANRDGSDDLILYFDFQPAAIFLQSKEGMFSPVEATSGVLEGLLASTKPGSIMGMSLDEKRKTPSLVAIKNSYVRSFTIDEEKNVVVEQQFNGRDRNARLSSAAVGSLRSRDSIEMVLLDRGNKVLTVYSWEDDAWNLLTNIDLQDTIYSTINMTDLDGDRLDDIVLTSEDRISVIYSKGLHGGLETLSTLKTSVVDGGYGTVYTSNLIGGSSPELIAIEMRDNLMEFIELGKDAEKRSAMNRFYQFLMFDRDRSMARGISLDSPPEPRELIAADIDDDGEIEIVCLMHDNIIVYDPKRKGE